MTNIKNDAKCTWNTQMLATETPLYGPKDELVAFYVAFHNSDGSPNGYLVINASPLNPCILEYAFDTGHEAITSSKKITMLPVVFFGLLIMNDHLSPPLFEMSFKMPATKN